MEGYVSREVVRAVAKVAAERCVYTETAWGALRFRSDHELSFDMRLLDFPEPGLVGMKGYRLTLARRLAGDFCKTCKIPDAYPALAWTPIGTNADDDVHACGARRGKQSGT